MIVLTTPSFISLFIGITNIYYVPDIVLGIGHGAVNKIDKVLFFRECTF